jgi:hypothetical protein
MMLAGSDRSGAAGPGYPDCVLAVVPGAAAQLGQTELGPDERRALRVLAEAGLIAPRHVASVSARVTGQGPATRPARAVSRRPPAPRPQRRRSVTEVT